MNKVKKRKKFNFDILFKQDLIFFKNTIIDFLLVFGKKLNKTELENLLKIMNLNMVFGKMVKEKNGLKMKKNLWRN